ncbi:hypothetical protein [uncultured Nevskia sp.]|uniref:CAF17-like 4Fe-4S cluster assembly/insertion protein YgfZ n=1 Tax=uncultured Nevskia sp. TaxID=228950 RepID=UPI0025E05948|nr:hypothetical protein [uncultured Nevskia sp.]
MPHETPPVAAPLPPGLPSGLPAGFDWLTLFGASIGSDDLPDFGDRHAEAAAALDADVIAPLADRGTIRVRGADRDAFLQGQLSSDIRELTPSRGQLASYSTPKGRVLAIFVSLRHGDDIWLETSRSVLAETLKRLRMFVMRSKVTLDDAGAEAISIGVAGPNADHVLEAAGLLVPSVLCLCAEVDGIVIMRRRGPQNRYSLHGPAERLAALWPKLAAHARPVGTEAWRLTDILAGFPALHPETREQHVAQMMNIDQLDGISFTKGCYPGQEIVARLHYLGNLKRRMFIGRSSAATIARGAPVVIAGSEGQSVGDVLDTALHPDGGQALLVVLQTSQQDSTALRIGSADGPELALLR